MGRPANTIDVVSAGRVQSCRGARSEREGLVLQRESALSSSAVATDAQDVGVFPGEDGVIVRRQHMEAMVQLLNSPFDVVPSGVGTLLVGKRESL